MFKYKTPDELTDKLKEYIIGQDEILLNFSIYLFQYLLYQYFKVKQEAVLPKSNLLLIGESGSGKTFMVKKAAELMGFTLIEINAKSISQEGWTGESFLGTLKHEISKIEELYPWIIVFIDEFDKLCMPCGSSKDENYSIHLQNSLLKYMEPFEFDYKGGKFNTSNLCFVFAGNFEEVRANRESKNIGFQENKEQNKEAIQKELENFGMIPEMIGRISMILELNSVTPAMYKQILSTDTFLYKLWIDLLLTIGIDFELNQEEMEKVLTSCEKQKIGVRGLIQEVNIRLFNTLSTTQNQIKDLFVKIEKGEL